MINVKFSLLIGIMTLSVILCQSQDSKATNTERYDWGTTHETSIAIGIPRTNMFMNIVSPLNFSPLNGYSRDRSDRTNLPVFSMDYGYNVLNWINVGVGFNYTHYKTRVINDRDDAISFNESINSMQLMVRIRFYWLNLEKIRLYSTVGAGILIQHGNMLDLDKLPDNPIWTDILPWFDICAIGITVGKKLYGNFQFGSMSSGLISAGIGYRF